MVLRFSKSVNKEIFDLKVLIEPNKEKGTIYLVPTDYHMPFIYRDGYFHIMGTFLIGGKSFTEIKCPKELKDQVEEYIPK